MQDEGRLAYIPIDLVTAMVTVADTRSLTKAAKKLGISQPAITSQLKRLDQIVGGMLFDKTQNGSALTALGHLVLAEARRILSANDQILRMSGTFNSDPTVRFGMTANFTREMLGVLPAAILKHLAITADNSFAITQAFTNGFLDIAYVIENSAIDRDVLRDVVARRFEPIVWVRIKELELHPGQPLPVLTWPGNDLIIPTLRAHDLSYRITFSSPDFQAIRAAACAGLGLMAWPLRYVPDRLVVADDGYLPVLKPVEIFLLARQHALSDAGRNLLDLTTDEFFPVTV